MKKLNLLLVLAGMFAFSACDDDSDKVKPVDPEVSALSGTWNLSLQVPYAVGEMDPDTWEFERFVNPYPSISLEWTAKSDTITPNANNLSLLATNLLSKLLPEVVHSITLSENGELTAEYYPSPIFNQMWNSSDSTWQEIAPESALMTWMASALLGSSFEASSAEEARKIEYPLYPRTWVNAPSGLVSWSLKDGMVNLKLDKEAIKAQISASGSTISFDALIEIVGGFLGEGGSDKLNALLENGIPLKYKIENNVLTFYIDKAMAAPYMDALLPNLPGLWSLVMGAVPEDMAPMVNGMLLPMLGLEKIEDLQMIWEKNTDKFEIALHFKRP